MADACDPSTWETEARGSGVQGHPLLQGEIEAGLDYVRHLTNETNDPFKSNIQYFPHTCKSMQTCVEGFVYIHF